MSTAPSPPLDLNPRNVALALGRGDRHEAVTTRTAATNRAESLRKAGNVMIVAGFIITIVGVVLYCAVCFAGGMDADMADVLFRNTVPFARATLGVLGLGTLVWLIGSFTYLRGAMDADDDTTSA